LFLFPEDLRARKWLAGGARSGRCRFSLCKGSSSSGNTERQWNLVFRLYPARERKILRNLPLLDFDGPDLPDRRRRRVSFLLASGKKWSKEQCHNGSTQAAR
jgi:hypothetical protein